MALHINLYHEIHKQAERERRDPVKLASLGGVLFLLLLVLFYFYRASAVTQVEHKRDEVKAQWAKLEPLLNKAIENEPKLLAQQKSNQALIGRLQGRFYWAPFLEKFASSVPKNVQILSLTGDVDVDNDKKKTLNVLLRGVAAGIQPRTAAEAFRRSLIADFSELYTEVSVVFDANSLEDGVETVVLDDQTLSTATFRLRLRFTPTPPAAQASSETPKTK